MIYISSSWKNRDRVRAFATKLRAMHYEVYDFTDKACRKTEEIPPEMFPEQFDPDKHDYGIYLDRPEWRTAVEENRKALTECDLVILLLPCGIDATTDWAYAVGRGVLSLVVGHPPAGERSPVHLWAARIVKDDAEALIWVEHSVTPKKIYYVDSMAEPGGNGSRERPFLTVEEAAGALQDGRGTISVAPGLYPEPVTVANSPNAELVVTTKER